MREQQGLSPLQVPEALRQRTLRRALAPGPRRVPKAVKDAALVLFCVVHVGWCLHAVFG
ncbi:MAG: hypothetical protein FJ086_08470 [Deltaproteobacteria bacterium]|nr:hypothetical protein [Deltaproteobacteria bacterium]